MLRKTIASDIANIAFVFDHSGRADQPIRVVASRSTILRAIRDEVEGFARGEGGALCYGKHPICLLQKKG